MLLEQGQVQTANAGQCEQSALRPYDSLEQQDYMLNVHDPITYYHLTTLKSQVPMIVHANKNPPNSQNNSAHPFS